MQCSRKRVQQLKKRKVMFFLDFEKNIKKLENVRTQQLFATFFAFLKSEKT